MSMRPERPDGEQDAAKADLVALRHERDALLVALAQFGQHRPGCASQWRAATGSRQSGPCDCGFLAATTMKSRAQ